MSHHREPQASSLEQRVVETWQRAFPDLTDPVDEPGTSILSDPRMAPTAWVSLWPVGQRVVTRVAPQLADRLHGLLEDRPAGHRLSADDVAGCWPGRTVERAPQRLHALDPVAFRAAAPVPGLEVRALTEEDRGAFEAFRARCSPEDLEEGEVGIGGEHEVTVGAFAGTDLVAVASMFAWRGFSDLGVVTGPAHRRRGAGRAVVSALCERLAHRPRVVVYRYALDNRGSAGIARSLGLIPVGVAESVRPPAPGP